MSNRSFVATFVFLVIAFTLSASPARAAAEGVEGPTKIGNFGPTGIEISLEGDRSLKVLDVKPNSPAAGKLEKDDIIVTINGKPPVDQVAPASPEVFGDFKRLASFITQAEAGDGVLKFTVRGAAKGATREVVVTIPVLGAYSKTWPVDCPKTRKIVRANADYIASIAGENGQKLIEHNLYNGFAILMLLSTGEEKDLDLVRNIYKTRMAEFKGPDTGPHSWHNGVQGIAVCEYYLRTGDESVMPLIDAICESARKYQVQGGWTHWTSAVNPQYTAGGLMNPAGTQLLTTLLMAKQCGAKVDDKALVSALTFWYRMAGHGNNPYGDHRPEPGNASNGKTEMMALAFGEAARAENGSLYAMARDVTALSALYDYPGLLQGHTGGYGALWSGIAAALLRDPMPGLYANRMEHTQWFFELSRRYNGAFGASGAGRYDDEEFGYATGLSLTAPLKTLQITGAPKSPHARAFTLPDRPWGRESDVDFLKLDPKVAYRVLDVPPHVEYTKIATADEAQLRQFARHPILGYREEAAEAIRDRKLFPLCEELLGSDDARARQTACMVINAFEPWSMRLSIGTRARFSLSPEQVTPRMVEGLMHIITDKAQPLWNVDQALLALAAVPGDQVKSRLDDITPWLHHEEWWLNESACVALTPVMRDEVAIKKFLPHLIEAASLNVHIRGRGTMFWMIDRALTDAPDSTKVLMYNAMVEMFAKTPKVPSPEPGVDYSGITSVALESTFGSIMAGHQDAILKAVRLSVQRTNDLRPRERDLMIEAMINVSDKLDDAGKKELGTIILDHYRPIVIGDEPAKLKEDMKAGKKDAIARMNKLLSIEAMAGRPGGWKLLGNKDAGAQEWWHTSFEPASKPPANEAGRYRNVELPESLTNWYQPDYDPAKQGWTSDEDKSVASTTPQWYTQSKIWTSQYLPQSGEVIFVRKSFELKDLDQAGIRLAVYSRQGFDVYLNGHLIASDKSRSKTLEAHRFYFDEKMRKELKAGTNVIAARSFIQYFGGGIEKTGGKAGGLMVYVEGLKDFPSVD